MLLQFIMDNITPRKCLISKVQMKSLLQSEYTDEKLNKGFDDCCGSIKPCSGNIAKIAVGIEELHNPNPSQIVGNVVEMEESTQKKCSELKKQKGMVSLMQKHNFVDGASAINSHFSDSGLFALAIEGPGSHSQELKSLVVDEPNSLKGPIDEVELVRAKKILKMNVLMAMERTEDRLEEIARNFMASWKSMTNSSRLPSSSSMSQTSTKQKCLTNLEFSTRGCLEKK
jgi:hypothetical protein